MKKTPLLIFCALLLCGSLHAKPVDANHARQAAARFLRQAGSAKPLTLVDITSQMPYTEFYTFTIEGGGFVLVAADDVATPILGYSLTNSFDPKGMPDHVAAWLEDYDLEIRSLKAALGPDNDPAPGWDPNDIPPIDHDVSPLLTTTWNQTSYYSKRCPTIGSSRAPTGCVATAVAQLMRFWQHPAQGYGSHSYTLSSVGTLSANFDTTYNWTLMPNALGSSSSTAQDNEVAKLMYHIGVAVEMEYGASSSGAVSFNGTGSVGTTAQTALMKYFKYKPSMTAVRLESYTTPQWRALLRAELDARRPVMYSGRSTSGGHAFVCDGYNNADQFHFNWGWGGTYDGYFAIGSLNPGVGGVGGNSSGTYNMSNAALIGVEPYTGTFGTGGTVSSTAVGGSGCAVTGTGAYSFGDTVVLRPSAAEGYRFSHWENGCNTGLRAFIPGGGNYNFTAHFEHLSGDTLSYCGSQSYATAFRIGSTTRWGIRLPASVLPNGAELQSVQLFVSAVGDHTFKAYTSHPSSSSPAVTTTVTFTSTQEDTWQTITLTNPLVLNGAQDLWLTFEYSADASAYPAAVCPTTGNNDGLLMGSYFGSSHNANNPYTFLIRGIFHYAPIPVVYDTATVPYYTGFEIADDRGWEFVNATPNGWAIGNATSQSGGSAMYVSNDGGTTNAYVGSPTCASFATRTFHLAAGQYNLSFNWKGFGESTWDFMRVFLCPASETPAASFFSSQDLARTGVPSGWTDISGAYLNRQTDWQDTAYLFQVASSGYYKVVFMWYNDNSNAGTAAAIDNVNLEKVILPATVPYATGFEVADDCDWEYVNASVNQWTIGSAISQNGSRALYISNDGGTNNAYTNSSATGTSFATRTVTLASGQYTLAFNWKLKGESSYDFMRVFLCPASATPSDELLGANTAAKRTTVPTGWLDIAAGMLVNQTTWQTASYDFTVATTGDYKLVFMWYNDHSDGDNPPAAIDNVQLASQVQQYTLTVNANNASMGSVSGGGTYAAGATATLTATPAAGHHFVQWNDGNTQNPRAVTVTATATYTATFAVNSYTLTVNANDAAMGSTTGGGSYTHGQTATLTATPAAGHHFVQWNDGNTQNPRTVTVTGNATYTATFAPNSYTLTVNANDNTMGSVSGGGSYDYNATATLTATAATGHHFVQWNDGNTQNPRTVTVTGNATYTATFAPNSYTLTVNANDNTMGSVSGGSSYDYNATATLTATPNSGYHFVQWQDGNTDNPRTVTVTANATYTATFEADAPVINYYNVSVNSLDNAMGTVSSTHSGSVEENTQVTVTATPATGHHFVQWQYGAGQTSTANPYTFTLTGDITLNALFAADTYALTATTNDNTMGSVSGGGEYTYGATATLYATPNSGYHFVQWQDGNTDNPRTVTVTANATYTATFEANAPDVTYYNVTVIADGSDMGTVSSTHSGSVAEGTQITVTANAAAGYRFRYWTDASGQQVSAANPYTFTLTQDITLIATFGESSVPPATYTVTINRMVNDNGTIRPMTDSEMSQTWVSGEGTYEEGTTVTVRASNEYPIYFSNWSSAAGVLSTDAEYQFVITGDTELTALFAWHTGIGDVEIGHVTLYPNPSSHKVALTGIEADVKVEIFDIDGRQAIQLDKVSAHQQIDISMLASGTYFVKIVCGKAATVRKLIVQ